MWSTPHVDFLVDVAFECHDEEAIRPVIDLLRRVEYISLTDITQGDNHMWSGYMYAFAACDIHRVSAVCHNLSTLLDLSIVQDSSEVYRVLYLY